MRQYTRLLRIALSILGSFLLAFMVLGLVFTFRIKKSTVTAEAKNLVENLGTKSEIDAASELAALQQTEVQTQAAGLEQAETQDLVQNESQVQDQNQEQAQTENGQESGTSLDAMIAQWNEELDADTVTNLTDEEQVAVRTLFANTIFFGDSMTQAFPPPRYWIMTFLSLRQHFSSSTFCYRRLGWLIFALLRWFTARMHPMAPPPSISKHLYSASRPTSFLGTVREIASSTRYIIPPVRAPFTMPFCRNCRPQR